MHDDRRSVEHRLDRVLAERLRPALHSLSVPCSVAAWHAGHDHVPVEQALEAHYSPIEVGAPWGPPWQTTWFRIEGTVPERDADGQVEAVVDLGFDADRPGFQCEALAYRPDGVPIKALNPRNTYLPVGPQPGDQVTYYLEAAATPLILGPNGFQPTPMGDPRTAGDTPLYRLERADLAVLDRHVDALVHDADVLSQLMRELPTDAPRRHEILRALERMLDRLDLHDIPATAPVARRELTDVLARPAHASAHRLSAIGHAHIDSAWLWPQRETIRKVARTVANVTALMDEHPRFRFAMSQAQQLAWLRDHHPQLFGRVRDHVHTGQFVPVGGMWVESDTNMPGGEALARQLVHGKRFFLDEFGIDTQEVWLPDSFGYSAALPQLVALSGSRWFLTQKISWNQTNAFPHHTFWWEGIDGTRVFTHFPPVDTYNSELTGAELAHASRNFAEHGHASRSLVPFGHGDGGGGPTRDMLARAYRTADLEGSPRVALESPGEFFTAAQEEHSRPAVWSGELYLEFHRGTYTSQAKTKQGNRRSEHLLREAELWCATAAVTGLIDGYPYDDLDRLWKTVLLHQFHDILPGSSISWVHREAEATYRRVATELEHLIHTAQRALAGESGTQDVTFNAAPHARSGVPAMGAAPHVVPTPATARRAGDLIILDNGLIRATVDSQGLLTSVFDHAAERELIPTGTHGNLLQLHADHPNAWDAWDIDEFYRHNTRDLTDVDEVTLENTSTVTVRRSFGRSTLVQRLSLAPDAPRIDIDTDIDWHESEKLLKAAFPLDLHAQRSASETQFGHVHRPTHTNTSWDAAKFEICAHRWIHLDEPGYGVTLANDSTYGHDVTRPEATTTTVRLSLLRAPRFPDPDTDQGHHHLRYALLVGSTIGDAVREGYRINLPERTVSGSRSVAPLITVDNDAVVVEAIKLADDRSGDLIVRLYESRGGRAKTHVSTSFGYSGITYTDLLERPLDDQPETGETLHLRPFQILTLRFART